QDGSRKPVAPADLPDPLSGLLPLDDPANRGREVGPGDGSKGDALLMVPMIGDRPGVPTDGAHPATPLEGPR
ncbi:MAG: hypothetical protein QOD96_4468, partial [Pseudonocardiales bacterium]|nr:hypothetical protein [Pseudonocardiales bacterium]